MRRKRKHRNRALTLPGCRVEEVGKVVGHAKVWAREHAFTITDDSVVELVLESVSALGLSLSDREIESAESRLLGRKRIAEDEWSGFAWHLL